MRLAKNVYLTGVTHGNLETILRKFENFEAEIRLNTPDAAVYQNIGFQSWSAAIKGMSFEQQMKVVIPTMLQCEVLYLMPCWAESREAIMLRDLAMRLNIPIVHL